MTNTCYIDLSQIGLAHFQERLETQVLLPGRKILQEEDVVYYIKLAQKLPLVGS